MSLLSALVPVLLSSCKTHYSLRAFDDLARTAGARTIVLQEKLSLYSPDEPFLAQEYLALIEKQRTEVFGLLGVDNESPILVQLHPNEGVGLDATIEGNSLRLNRLLMEPDGGFLGKAGDDTMVIEVAARKVMTLADGSPIVNLLGATMYKDTIRHELTHLATNLLGLRGDDWLREGIAHAVEWIPIEDGSFDLDPVPDSLRSAASLTRERGDLDRTLAWKQSFPPVEQDRPARMLAHSLVVFLIEREGAPSLREGVLRVAAYPPSRIRAAHADWSAWLDGLAPAP
jgi:hypothetical protein